MRFKPSTHPDFQLEAIEDGQKYYIGYMGTPAEFKAFAQKTGVFPYIFEVDLRDMTSISRTRGFLTWNHAYPGWKSVQDGDELVQVVANRIKSGELDYSSLIPFLNKFKFGIKSELNIYNGFNVAQVSREDTEYDNFYQGVKLA